MSRAKNILNENKMHDAFIKLKKERASLEKGLEKYFKKGMDMSDKERASMRKDLSKLSSLDSQISKLLK